MTCPQRSETISDFLVTFSTFRPLTESMQNVRDITLASGYKLGVNRRADFNRNLMDVDVTLDFFVPIVERVSVSLSCLLSTLSYLVLAGGTLGQYFVKV